jgi:Cu/Ag efflux protein CusF
MRHRVGVNDANKEEAMRAARMEVLVAVASLALAPLASADDATKKMPSASVAKTSTMTATVTAIDVPARSVTLKGPRGNSVTLHVGDDVKNLDQVKVGDTVVAKYYESVAIKVTGAGAPAAATVSASASAPAGQMPAGAVAHQQSIKAKVTGIGKHKDWVTLTGPEGNAVTIQVKNKKNLDGVKVGDDVEVTYTEALAIAVDRPAPAKK